MGCFVRDGCSVDYVGDQEEYSVNISRDTLCYNELLERAKIVYHIQLGRVDINLSLKLHWLVPGKSFTKGLMFVGDDDAISRIDSSIPYGQIAEIYVEKVLSVAADEEDIEEEDRKSVV